MHHLRHKWFKIVFVNLERRRTYRRCWTCSRFQVLAPDMWSNWVDFDYMQLTVGEKDLIDKFIEGLRYLRCNSIEIRKVEDADEGTVTDTKVAG